MKKTPVGAVEMKTHGTALKMKFYKLLRCLFTLESRAVLQGQTFKVGTHGK